VAKFAALFPWLRDLFPPSEARGFQPSEISEDVSLVHQVHQGTDFLDVALTVNVSSAAGVAQVFSPVVDDGFYHYVIACGMNHDDPTSRRASVGIDGTTIWPLVDTEGVQVIPSFHFLSVPRAFILPTHQRLQARVNTIAAGQVVTLRALYFKIPLGSPAPPS